MAYKELNQMVKGLLEEHVGGREYFDKLDEKVQDKDIVQRLIGLVEDFFQSYDNCTIVVSGGFGRFFTNSVQGSIIVVNGGLRTGEPVDDLSYLEIAGRELIFVDDSFYSGRTRDIIRDEIKRNGGELIRTFVVYDGSKNKDETVESLYRYYDEVKK